MARQSIRHQVRDPWWWGGSLIWILMVTFVSQGLENKNLWLVFASLVFGLLAGTALTLAKGKWLVGLPELIRTLRRPNAPRISTRAADADDPPQRA